MASTTGINVGQESVVAGVRAESVIVKAGQLSGLAGINFPTASLRADQLVGLVTVRENRQVRVGQAVMMVTARGKVDNPKLKSWTYTLDGHDFYILKLGTYFKTLVYDLTTGSWSWWTTNPVSDPNQVDWRAATGLNWLSSGSIPYDKGSNVIVGDESLPVLWVLDPEYGLDENVLNPTQGDTFRRVATGQITTSARTFLPCYEVDLSYSPGATALSLDTVVLDYSDDSGYHYITADGPATVDANDLFPDLQWRSLGMIRSPGRLFRITDDGAFARIDELDVNPEAGT